MLVIKVEWKFPEQQLMQQILERDLVKLFLCMLILTVVLVSLNDCINCE